MHTVKADERPRICLIKFENGVPMVKVKHYRLKQKGYLSTEWAKRSKDVEIVQYYVPDNFEEIKNEL